MADQEKKIAVIQSNYIPWKGYFDVMNMVDVFVIYDHVQYTKRDWRNRNKIKCAQGNIWLSIPVEVKGKYHQKINETKISDQSWAQKHWKSISHCYSTAKYFKDYKDVFEEIYMNNQEELLSKVNFRFIQEINKILEIDTEIIWDDVFPFVQNGEAEKYNKTEKLIKICQDLDGTEYISGPKAQSYTDESLFEKAKIKLTWMDYSGYKPYKQAYGDFEHGVTILDLIFNEGPNAKDYMKSFE